MRGALPLSIDLASTVWALGIVRRGAAGVRHRPQGVRGRAASGSPRAASPRSAWCSRRNAWRRTRPAHGRMYWRWKPLSEGAAALRPVRQPQSFRDLGRDGRAAVPRLPARARLRPSAATRSLNRFAPTWHKRVLDWRTRGRSGSAASICLMLVALVASLSRAGMVGLISALAARARTCAARRTGSPAATWAIAAIGLAVVAAAHAGQPGGRLSSASARSAWRPTDRLAIWQATLPVVNDFWLTGTGAGTFETVMLVYQRTPSLFRINAAHNHYLQVAAEGGLLVGIPVARGARPVRCGNRWTALARRRLRDVLSPRRRVERSLRRRRAERVGNRADNAGQRRARGAGRRDRRAPIGAASEVERLTCRCDSASTSTACSPTSARPSANRGDPHRPTATDDDFDPGDSPQRRVAAVAGRRARACGSTSPRRRTGGWRSTPYEPEQIARLYSLTRAAGWEVFFLTKRPPSAGDSVQFQTQWWIERFGFYLPSVLTVPGSRGDVANALRLDLLVDDQLINCVEVVSASPTKAILMQRAHDAAARDHATSRGIGVVADAGRRAGRDRAAAGAAAAEARPPAAADRVVHAERGGRRRCRRIRGLVRAAVPPFGDPRRDEPRRGARSRSQAFGRQTNQTWLFTDRAGPRQRRERRPLDGQPLRDFAAHVAPLESLVPVVGNGPVAPCRLEHNALDAARTPGAAAAPRSGE